MCARPAAGRAALLAMALAFSSPALVSAAPPGVNLRWDQCFSDGGTANKTFACDTNAGSERLVMSFVLDSDMSQVSGNEVVLKIQSASATLPSWWLMKNPGTCRQTSLAFVSTIQAGAVNCVDWGDAAKVGGIGVYTVGYYGDNSVRVALAIAVPPSDLADLVAGQEYFSGALIINHAKSVGTGACTGCDQPVCIVIEQLNITTPTVANDIRVAGGASAPNSEFARWQNALETNVTFECHVMSGCTHTFACVDASTPTRGSTWGAVKALYR
jgi:hypothetical protein